MSFITSSAYPRQMTVTNTFLWKTVDNQCLGSSTGSDACVGFGADHYEAIDRVFENTLKAYGEGSHHMEPCSFVAPKRFKVVIDEIGVIPKTVKVFIGKNKVMHVFALCQVRLDSGIYVTKEFRKVYQLPHYVNCDKVVPLFTETGQMIIELPILEIGEGYPSFGGQFGGSLYGRIQSETMIPREEQSSFGPKSTGYPRTMMSDKSEAQYDWKQLNRALPSEWDESKFSTNTTPFSKGYKNYGF